MVGVGAMRWMKNAPDDNAVDCNDVTSEDDSHSHLMMTAQQFARVCICFVSIRKSTVMFCRGRKKIIEERERDMHIYSCIFTHAKCYNGKQTKRKLRKGWRWRYKNPNNIKVSKVLLKNLLHTFVRLDLEDGHFTSLRNEWQLECTFVQRRWWWQTWDVYLNYKVHFVLGT